MTKNIQLQNENATLRSNLMDIETRANSLEEENARLLKEKPLLEA